MKRSKKFERLRFFLKGVEGTSAAQPIDEPLLKVNNEPKCQIDQRVSMIWTRRPSRDSFRVDSDFSDLTIGSSRATESERETILSTSSSTLSRRSYIHRELLEKTKKADKAEGRVRELTQQTAEMNKALTQMQAMCATTPSHQQKPVFHKSVTTKLSNDTMVEPMTAPTIDEVADAISFQ